MFFFVIEKRQTDIHIELFSPATIPSTKKTRTKTQYHFGYDHVFCLSKVTEVNSFLFLTILVLIFGKCRSFTEVHISFGIIPNL